MANPLERSIVLALRANDDLERLFAQVGTREHPRGRIVTVYRNARRAMQATYRGGVWDVFAVQDVLSNLERSVREIATLSLMAGREVGLRNVRGQLSAYGLGPPPPTVTVSGPAVNAIVAGVQRQTATAIALVQSGADPAMILGDERRVGVFSFGPTAADTADWSAKESEIVFANVLLSALAGSQERFQKQAIAAIDNRTTMTCLRVNGQIREIDQPFHLTEEPRYADYQDWPPFHRWCRTATVLYLARYDAGLTERMLEASATAIGGRRRT